jgi:hypothetical protein
MGKLPDSKPGLEGSNPSAPAILKHDLKLRLYRRIMNSIHRLWQYLLRQGPEAGLRDRGVGCKQFQESMNGVCCE